MIRVVGLTGGIASGKSTVAALLEAKGVPVLDADKLAREVVEPGTPAATAIALRWPEMSRGDGSIDRDALGKRIFADAGQRAALEAIVLPQILEAFRARVAELESRGEPLCVFEAPTLLEEGLDALVDGVLLVTLPAPLQLERLRSRTPLSIEEARLRLAAQLPLEAKIPRARWLLDNAGPLHALPAKLDLLWDQVRRDLGLR